MRVGIQLPYPNPRYLSRWHQPPPYPKKQGFIPQETQVSSTYQLRFTISPLAGNPPVAYLVACKIEVGQGEIGKQYEAIRHSLV